MQDVLTLVSILKQTNSDEVFDKVLETSLEAGSAHFKIEKVDERLARLNAGDRVYGCNNRERNVFGS